MTEEGTPTAAKDPANGPHEGTMTEEGTPTTTTAAAGGNELQQVFNEFDKDGSGKIDAAELKDALRKLGHEVSDDKLKKYITQVDVNNDGEVDLAEFVQLACENCTLRFLHVATPPVSRSSLRTPHAHHHHLLLPPASFSLAVSLLVSSCLSVGPSVGLWRHSYSLAPIIRDFWHAPISVLFRARVCVGPQTFCKRTKMLT